MPLTKVNKEFRNVYIKRALKSYVVPAIAKHYQIVTIRAMLKETDNDRLIWGKRREMEHLLNSESSIAGFFTCITGLEEKKSGEDEKKIIPGVCFWIFFDWPGHGVSAFEIKITKLFMESGLDIKRCYAVKPRGKLLSIYTK